VRLSVPRRSLLSQCHSFSSSVNSKCYVTSPVRKAYGLPGTDFHTTLYTEFHLNRTIHLESMERNSFTPLTEDAHYQHTHKHSTRVATSSIAAQLHVTHGLPYTYGHTTRKCSTVLRSFLTHKIISKSVEKSTAYG
jgi:hypothetical protein